MLAVIGGAVLLAVVVPGLWLWWPGRREARNRSDLGVALMTGTLVAFAVLAVQILFELRLDRLEKERQVAQDARNEILRRQAEHQSLGLAVGLQHNLTGIDLRGRDLSGLFLGRKRLKDAQLAESNLEGAFLAGSNLVGANLQSARLPHAILDDTLLEAAILTGADLRGARLRGARMEDADLSQADLRGAVLTDAVLAGAAIGGARYDSLTKWPTGADVKPCEAGRVCTVGA
jgi:uncharacterized protein YjbI with pentapeptide repeats